MSTLIGEAVVFAMDGITVAFAGTATAHLEPTGANVRDTFDKVDIKGATGRTIARGGANRRHIVTVDVTVKDTGGSASRASARSNVKLPTPFALVTLAGFNNALMDGSWNYEEGSIVYSNLAEAKVTLTLARMENAGGGMAAMSPVT